MTYRQSDVTYTGKEMATEIEPCSYMMACIMMPLQYQVIVISVLLSLRVSL